MGYIRYMRRKRNRKPIKKAIATTTNHCDRLLSSHPEKDNYESSI
ncbi:MAG: hypothetical protein V7K67_08950 [Nostoc sp.]